MKLLKLINTSGVLTDPLTVGKLYEVNVDRYGACELKDDNGRKVSISYVRFTEPTYDEQMAYINAELDKSKARTKELQDKYDEVEADNRITVGSFWAYKGNPYIVAKISQNPTTYCLIELTTGNRWCEPKKDIKEVFGGEFNRFTKMNRPF